MTSHLEIQIGEMYGRLVPLQYAGMNADSIKFYYCQCICGNLRKVRGTSLKSGETKSCGCLQREVARNQKFGTTHGLYSHPTHSVWTGIKTRCYNQNEDIYQYYGARGISVCDEWRYDFKAFYEWAIANGYRKGLDLDRINEDGNYEPTNCQFIPHKDNCRKKRNTKLTQEKVDAIRSRPNARRDDLAKEFGVSVASIKAIRSNRLWT